jgi:hypothetical protein
MMRVFRPSHQQRSFMMTSIPQVAQAMQTVLTTIADQAGRDSDFIVRESKLSGSTFVQTLVFGWLADPQATLEALAQTAAAVGVTITAQGLDQRFSETAAACLEQVLAAAVTQLIAAEPVAVPILARFAAVEVRDSSTISLPAALADVFFGCMEGTAALKVHLGLELCTGALTGPTLTDSCRHDSTVGEPTALPPQSLHLADLGYFDLELFATLAAQESYFLSRFKTGTIVSTLDGERQDLLTLVEGEAADLIDLDMRLGRAQQVQCRLLAMRAPQEVVDQRRRRLRAEARRHGRTVSAISLALAAWTLLITNVPREQLSGEEALILARTRWQIELIFKLWKTHGQIDQSRSDKPWRVLCEVYAKLLAMLVQHWILVINCWCYPDRSLMKAAQTVRQHALHLACVVRYLERLVEGLTIVQRCLASGCRINKSTKTPHTYQLLLSLSS